MNRQFDMNTTNNIFDISSLVTPQIVQSFTLLRQSTCVVNELNYPELRCVISACDEELAGQTASKLTMALSIHLESFLGLTCREMDDSNESTELCARFSNFYHAEEIVEEIDMKAADIIDTLMSLA